MTAQPDDPTVQAGGRAVLTGGWPEALGFEDYARKLEDMFSIDFAHNPFRRPSSRIMIACTSRTGSNFLCENLQEYGALIGEYLRFSRIQNFSWKPTCDTLEKYCENIIERFSRRGVFGVKGAINILPPLILAGELPDYANEWKFVFLRRQDLIKQAISYHIAQRSGSFRSTHPGRELADDEYDAARIERLVGIHAGAYEKWEQAFGILGVAPYRLTYEELVADPTGVTARVADFLGLHGPPLPEKKPAGAGLKKQASTRNTEWEARFREERASFCATITERGGP